MDMVFFYIYIIGIMLLGTVKIEPLSIRVYMTVFMILFLLFRRGISKGKTSFDRVDHSYIYVYVIFSILMGLALLLNGEFLEYGFPKKILAYNIVCICTFYAIEYFINSKLDIVRFINLLSVILVFNNCISILQLFQTPMGWTMGAFFSDISNYEDMEENVIGASVVCGIFGHPVKNAFSVTVLCPLMLVRIARKERPMAILYYLFVIATSIVTIYATKQRAAFALISFTMLFYILTSIKERTIYVVVAVIIACFVIPWETLDWGRIFDSDNSSRQILWKEAFGFIPEHILLGGPMAFQRRAGLSTHNFFLDSWIFSGLCGFICMMILYFKTIIIALKSIYGVLMMKTDKIQLYSALSVLNAMLYGLFHNTSYLTGSELIFIVLSIMLKSISVSRY